MKKFSCFLYFLSMFNMVFGAGYSIFGYIYPQKIIYGTALGLIGGWLFLIGFGVTLIIMAIYIAVNKVALLKIHEMIEFNSFQKICILILIIYVVVRWFVFRGTIEETKNDTITGVSFSLLLNYILSIVTRTIIQNYKQV